MTTHSEGAEDPRELADFVIHHRARGDGFALCGERMPIEQPTPREGQAVAGCTDCLLVEREHEQDPAAERALEREKIRSSIPADLAAQADAYVTLEACEGCGDLIRATLPEGWELSVNGTPAYAIPIVGCGSPWHYVERRGRGAWLRSMGDPLEPDPGVRRVAIGLQWPDAHVSAEAIDWPADVRLPVAGDALRLPGIGVCVVSGVAFDASSPAPTETAELVTLTINATVIAGSDR